MKLKWAIAVLVMFMIASFECAFGAGANADAKAIAEDDAIYRVLRGDSSQQRRGATNNHSSLGSSRLESADEESSGTLYLIKVLQFNGDEEVKLFNSVELGEFKRTLRLETVKVDDAYLEAEKEWQENETVPFPMTCPNPRKISNIRRFTDREKAEKQLAKEMKDAKMFFDRRLHTQQVELSKVTPEAREERIAQRKLEKKAFEMFVTKLNVMVQQIEEDARKDKKEGVFVL